MMINLFLSIPIDIDFITAIIVLCCIFIVVLVLILVFSRKKKIDMPDTNVRLYRIDYLNRTVTSVDKKDLKNHKSYTYDDFILEVAESDRAKIRNWIGNIISDKDNSHFCVCQVYLNGGKSKEKSKNKPRIAKSMFEVTSINPEKKIIHLESRLLFNMFNQNKFKFFNKRSKVIDNIELLLRGANRDASLTATSEVKFRRKLSKNATLIEKLKEQLETESYVVFCVFISPLYNSYLSTNQKELNQVRWSLVNEIVSILTDDYYIAPYEKDKIAIIYFDQFNRSKNCSFAFKIVSLCKKYLELNSIDDVYSISVGLDYLVHIKDKDVNYLEFKNHLNNAFSAAIQAQNENLNNGERVLVYNQKEIYKNKQSESKAYSNIIKNSLFKIYYQPVVNLVTGDIILYDVFIEPIDISLVPTIDKVIYYAYKHDLLSQLYTKITSMIEESIPNGIKTDLMLQINLEYIEEILRLIVKNDLNIKINLMVDEDDLYNYELEEIKKKFVACNYSGINIALYVKNPVMDIESEIISEIAYFVIDGSLVENVSQGTNEQTRFNILLENLQSYNKKIIIKDVNDNSSINYCLKSDCQNFISNLIYPQSSSMKVLTMDEKEQLIEKYKER